MLGTAAPKGHRSSFPKPDNRRISRFLPFIRENARSGSGRFK